MFHCEFLCGFQYLVDGSVQIAQRHEGHVVLDGVNQRRDAELQQLLRTSEDVMDQSSLTPADITRLPA